MEADQMTATLRPPQAAAEQPAAPRPAPRFGGVLWRIARLTSPVTIPLAGKRWNPIFAVVEHRGRKTGRAYATPVAARRIPGGFVIALAFGSHVDWYRNLVAAAGATIRWRGRRYRVSAPEQIDSVTALDTFLPIQRVALRIGGVDGYVRVTDMDPRTR
jgi:deazaflavin-dependent oxidoreductase (nitroreductase family)